jgi:hypothetical protein
MKKFVLTGMAVPGIAVLAVVNVNLGNKGSNISGVALKNLEALTQENDPLLPMKYLSWTDFQKCFKSLSIVITNTWRL